MLRLQRQIITRKSSDGYQSIKWIDCNYTIIDPQTQNELVAPLILIPATEALISLLISQGNHRLVSQETWTFTPGQRLN